MAGDALDFESWYELEHPRLLASLLLATGDLELAREAVDEACARTLARWSRVGRMDAPSGYAYRVAINVAHRRRRRAALEQRLLARRPPPLPTVPGPAGEAWAVVRELPPRQRTAVVLRYVADLTEAEIARAMGISRSTVSSTLADARRTLAVLLAEPDPEVADHHA
ncbi:MAG TPA: sigma-70 family RNA polymerase sigma factor [Acidimicrobiia bacterium]|nr:sigma-70 family RNA polymerase sigma factor [Acidimicrobiia bacterium]